MDKCKEEYRRRLVLLETALKLIQAYGRSVRSKDDWAKTVHIGFSIWLFCKEK